MSPGSILIRVQLSSSSPLVPIEIAPINSRPNEKGCWHLLCVREEKKNLLLSFYVGYDGTDQWCPGGDNLFPPFSIYVQTDVYISFYCSGFWVRATSTINPLLCFPPTKANFFFKKKKPVVYQTHFIVGVSLSHTKDFFYFLKYVSLKIFFFLHVFFLRAPMIRVRSKWKYQ